MKKLLFSLMALVAVTMISCDGKNNGTNGNEPEGPNNDSIQKEQNVLYYLGTWESKEMSDTSIIALEALAEILPIDISAITKIPLLGENVALAPISTLKIGTTLNEDQNAEISIALKVAIRLYGEKEGKPYYFDPRVLGMTILGGGIDTTFTAPATYEMKDNQLSLTVEVVEATGSKTEQTLTFDIKKVSDDHIFVGLTQEMVDAIDDGIDMGLDMSQFIIKSTGDISTMMQEKKLELWKNK